MFITRTPLHCYSSVISLQSTTQQKVPAALRNHILKLNTLYSRHTSNMSNMNSPPTPAPAAAKTTITTKTPHYILSCYIPVPNTTQVCTAVCQASGAGSYPGGLYTEAYWITRGTGQFRPMGGANPAIGTVGAVEKVEEDKVEILCVGRECMLKAVEAIVEAHPYEQVPYYVVKVEDV